MKQRASFGIGLVRHSKPKAPYATGEYCYGAADIDIESTHFAATVTALNQCLPGHVRLFTSPLRRCSALAQALHALRPASELHVEPRLAEMNFGAWEGIAWARIPRAEIDEWTRDFWHFRGHGGESVDAFTRRVCSVLSEIQASNDDRPAICITHQGPIRVALASQSARGVAALPETQGLEFGGACTVMIDRFESR